MPRVTRVNRAALGLPPETEREFQRSVMELAGHFGWRRAHFRPARVMRHGRETWETPIDGDAKGWPDVIFVRGRRMIVAELKSAKGKVSAEQAAWLTAFSEVPGVECYVWRPENWPDVQDTLTRTHARAALG